MSSIKFDNDKFKIIFTGVDSFTVEELLEQINLVVSEMEKLKEGLRNEQKQTRG